MGFIDPKPLLPLVVVWFGRLGWVETAFIEFCIFWGFDTAMKFEGIFRASG